MSSVADARPARTDAEPAHGKDGAPEASIKRNLVVQRWGTPTATVGSVNEPREMEERGHRFNEKWTYQNAGTRDAPAARVIYWLRYDFVASYLVAQGEAGIREDPRSLLAGLRDRLYRPLGEGHRAP